mgnify:FL=1
MPKGYWVAHVDVRDPAAYDLYRQANAAPFAEYGARFIVRGAPQTQMEGQTRARTVVIEFPTLEAAHACYASPAYQAAKALRDPVSTGDLVILAGWEG